MFFFVFWRNTNQRTGCAATAAGRGIFGGIIQGEGVRDEPAGAVGKTRRVAQHVLSFIYSGAG